MLPIDVELDEIIEQALGRKASDVHFLPQKEELVVRFRQDGLLRHVRSIPKEYQDKLINRIKILSALDIGEKRIPQDGRWFWTLGSLEVQLRVSTLPTLYGESIVLRLMAGEEGLFTLADLGMEKSIIKDVTSLLSRPYGIYLVAGPTGSGKSSTLYALLRLLNKGDRNIISLENPVECALKGVNQVQINEKAGLTFANGLRAILRQDPDIIMVGEIRDKETAQLAIQAALTGHFVLSSIHTNNAAAAVERLIDMGIEAFLVKATLVGVLAQRLARRPCPICKGGDFHCTHCQGEGYKGRIAIYESLYIPREGFDLSCSESYVRTTLAETGERYVRKGLTTEEELIRLGLKDKEAFF